MARRMNGLVFGILVGAGGIADAALYDRGSGLIYDDVLDITWMRDADYARTSGYDDDGVMHWNEAMSWVAGLEYAGYDDWRLPAMRDTGPIGCQYRYSGSDCGYSVLTTDGATVYSELASLWYDTLGNQPYYDEQGAPHTDRGLRHTGPFENLSLGAVSYVYWTNLSYAPNPAEAWRFHAYLGEQRQNDKNFNTFHAWAVRDGDVSPAPLPAAAWLFGSVLLMGAGAGIGRRR